VFQAILQKAHALCKASFGALMTYDGERFYPVTHQGTPTPFREFIARGIQPRPGDPFGRMVEEAPLSHIHDLLDVAKQHPTEPLPRAAVDLGGIRTLLVVPLRKDASLLGAITAYRQEVNPFSDKQIALLQNFAAQAVIAIENARLITETREALEQQTATAEVLGVINSSPGDLAPVFDTMLSKALTLCGAAHGHLYQFDGDLVHILAVKGEAHFVDWMRQRGSFTSSPATPLGQLLAGKPVTHLADARNEEAFARPQFRALIEAGSIRTVLGVPLRKDDTILGCIFVFRQEVRPFSDKQIALLENFAAQAVIAMENARLITETREALERQTATAEVLQVINSSPGDLTPVFDAILEKAHALCDSAYGGLLICDGENFRLVAAHGESRFVEAWRQRGPVRPPEGSAAARLIHGERVVHVADVCADDSYRNPLEGVPGADSLRTLLVVSLRKDDALLGAITAFRQEVRPFTDKQIALLQNFAAQAVIAMENARLITETREALEQQTATAEVLQVINSSPGNLQPVFEAMLDNATRLCEAVHGTLATYDGEFFRFVAAHGEARLVEAEQARGLLPPSFGVTWPRLLHGESVVHVTDAMDTDLYRTGHEGARWFVDIGGGRALLTIALRKEDALLGALTVFRQEVRPFSDKQIALLQNFAAQAVIAMENARLIAETREALDQQTATAEVLQVINSSPGNLQPVFEAMLDKAMRLCGAAFGLLSTYDGERFHQVALRQADDAGGEPARFAEYLAVTSNQPGPGSASRRLLSGERLVHISDLSDEEIYRSGDPYRRALVDLGGARTLLAVPLRKDNAFLGVVNIYRQEVRPFSDKQIALLQNFAAQAVIAMENARLLDEIRQRQAELRVTFDNMVDGVAMFDAELRLAASNRNFQELLDLPNDFLAERHGFDEFVRYLTERGEFGETDPDTEIDRLTGRLREHYQFERTRPDGTVIEVRHNPMPDGGVVLIYSDITERKRSEAEIRAARDAAEAAYRDLKAAQASLIQAEKMASLGQLTAGIAHEIKNPLNFVNNFAGLSAELLDELKETAAPAINALGDEKRAEIDETITMLTGNLEKIAEHGRRADGIVISMLEHSRGTSGERRSVHLNGLIEEALNLAYHGGRAQDASFNITLERDFAEAIAPIELVPQDITRVCLNLFGNGFYAATKRQKQGGDPKFKPTLKVSTRDLGDAVEINIRDNGVGIPPEIKDKLFQPFFTTKPTGEGTGLGLSISYDIVTLEHGGTITADSQIGEFTEFTIRLPRVYGATIAEAAS
jgi:GAF domain-containing protein